MIYAMSSWTALQNQYYPRSYVLVTWLELSWRTNSKSQTLFVLMTWAKSAYFTLKWTLKQQKTILFLVYFFPWCFPKWMKLVFHIRGVRSFGLWMIWIREVWRSETQAISSGADGQFVEKEELERLDWWNLWHICFSTSSTQRFLHHKVKYIKSIKCYKNLEAKV